MKVKIFFILTALMLWAIILRADEILPVLQANGQVYSNATVFKVTATDIFFYSEQGAGNIKLKDLDPALRKHFETGTPIPAAPSDQKKVVGGTDTLNHAAPKTAPAKPMPLNIPLNLHVPPAVVLIVGVVLLFFYLILCYCLKRICENCGSEPGILIWIPVFNLIRLLQAGGLSGWLFLLFFVPIVNVAIHVWMWIKICRACGKSPWLVLLMFVPIANLVFIAYLAFSETSGTKEEAATSEKSSPANDKLVLP